MIVGLCNEGIEFDGFVVRTIGLEALEGYRSVKWAGGVDFFIEDERELKLFVERYAGFIYAVGKEGMEEVVGRLLRESGLRLATAESCTAGLLSARLVNVPGSSQYFVGGFVVYANELKTKVLGLRDETIRRYGAVSEEVCRQMAVGALEETDADVSIAITGISGPEGGTEQKPVGLTYIALATDREVVLRKFLFQGSRNENRFMATQWALEMLRKYLTKGV